MHCGKPWHTCQFFGKGVMNKCHIKKHMELCSMWKSRRKKSAEEFMDKCTVFNLVFANSKNLPKHLINVHGIAKSTHKFARHVVWRQGILKCLMCSQIFKRTHYLKNHMARHMAKTGQE